MESYTYLSIYDWVSVYYGTHDIIKKVKLTLRGVDNYYVPFYTSRENKFNDPDFYIILHAMNGKYNKMTVPIGYISVSTYISEASIGLHLVSKDTVYMAKYSEFRDEKSIKMIDDFIANTYKYADILSLIRKQIDELTIDFRVAQLL